MLNAANADLIAATASPRPNGADQVHGMRMLGRRAHLSVVSAAASASPMATGQDQEEDQPWSSLRPLFLCILGLAFVAGGLAARAYLFGR